MTNIKQPVVQQPPVVVAIDHARRQQMVATITERVGRIRRPASRPGL
jgi:hypothetical protein